jgi:glycosyltransferase involved in cell wall biosynthesis
LRSLRIAFLDSWLQQTVDGSGTAKSINGLDQALRRRGQRVTRIAPLRSWPRTLTLRRLLFNLQLPALLRRLHYDLIVGFDIDGVLWAGRQPTTPYIACIKGVIAEELQHERGRTRLLFRLLAQLERINVRRADAVLTDSVYGRTAISQHYGVAPTKVRLVPAGIELARWNQLVTTQPYAGDGATIVCVARQYPRKHVADLLRAMPAVRRALPQAHAVIIGDGPEHARLRALATELELGPAATFLGALPDDDEVARWYRRADIFCLPSVQENFGMVFVEAMASGLPVVATSAAAIPEVVPQRQAGILVPPADVHALATALIELLQRPDLRAAYGSFGRQHVVQYDWDHIAALFLDAVADYVRL